MQEGRCVMDRSAETKPAAVPVATTTAKQAGSCRARWAWSEPTIWTERMLAALEKGVKGGKWFWPNAFFADLGLFNLTRAHQLARQPS